MDITKYEVRNVKIYTIDIWDLPQSNLYWVVVMLLLSYLTDLGKLSYKYQLSYSI